MHPLASYATPPALWLVDAVMRNTGFTVEVNEDLEHNAAVDTKRGVIEVVPGLSFPRFHIALGRAGLFTIFGESVIPEFRRDLPELPSGVVPLLRHKTSRRGVYGYPLSS